MAKRVAVITKYRDRQHEALRTGLGLLLESHSVSVVVLNHEIERSEHYLDNLGFIDEMGGAVSAIEQGYQMDEIDQAAYEYTKSIDDDERVIVGLNKFQIDDEPEPSVFPIDPTLEGAQQARLAGYKANRVHSAVDATLESVRAAARGTDNLLYPMKEALRAGATLGEVSDALRDVFGMYQP